MTGSASRPQRVLVTGASGAVGRHLVSMLLVAGRDVLALSRQSSIASPAGLDSLQVLLGDILDQSVVQSAVSQSDAVCHLAAYLPPDYLSPTHAARCFEVNALATQRIAQQCAEQNKRFIYCSSAQAYVYSDRPVAEDDPMYPAERATYYLVSKLAGELFVEHLRRTQGLQALSFRVSSSYGPGMPQRSLVRSFVDRAHAGMPLVVQHGGVPTCDFVYVGDVAQLIAAAIDEGECGIYNAGSGASTSILELAQAIQSLFAPAPIPIEVVPPLRDTPSNFPALSMEKTKRMWNHEPTPLDAGLRKYLSKLERTSACV